MKYVNCYKFIQKQNSESKYIYYGKILVDDIFLFTKDVRTISSSVKVRKVQNKHIKEINFTPAIIAISLILVSILIGIIIMSGIYSTNSKDGNWDKANAIMSVGCSLISSFVVLTGIISIVYIIPFGKKHSELFIKEEDYQNLIKDNEIIKDDLE